MKVVIVVGHDDAMVILAKFSAACDCYIYGYIAIKLIKVFWHNGLIGGLNIL